MKPEEKELYDVKITGIHSMIVANADLQNEVNKNILATLKRIEAQVNLTNGRVGLLERFQWTLTGKIIGISTVIGALFGMITFLMSS